MIQLKEDTIHKDDAAVQESIAQLIKTHKVILFMKGTAKVPLCGFSGYVTQVLTHLHVDFEAINVLEDSQMRQGIKDFTQWPTIPQLYIDGEFVGGADIVKEMFEAGELQNMLDEKGIAYQKAS